MTDEKASMIKDIVQANDLNDNVKDKVMGELIEGDVGMLDKIFGKRNTEKYISAIIIILILISGTICSAIFKDNVDFVEQIWQLLVPAITLILGYMFGKTK